MKKKILEITIKNHLNNIKWAFFSALIYYSIVFIAFKDDVFSTENALFIIVHLWVIVQFIIVLYIHITYFFENKDFKLRIENGYIFDVMSDKKIYNSDIKKITINKSYALTAGRVPFFPFQHYKYCEVILNDGKKIILTSLLKRNIDEFLKENLKGVLFENNFTPFCFFL
ncbi:MAG: hypothetical protein IM568_01980 [Flavobacterium sp.]|nr:hypothetical protein [Flavobacterium sp.]